MVQEPDNQLPKPDPEPVKGSETSRLVRQAKSGEPTGAWTPLSEKILYYLRTRFGNAGFPPGTEFDDFVSDLMARVMTSIKNFEERGDQSFWRWVQTIGGNLWRDMWRRFERDRKLGIAGRGESSPDSEDSSVRGVDAASVTADSPTGIVRFRELERAEEECVAKLSGIMREVYLQRRVHDLSFAEISAKNGGINHATLRSHYLRAREAVRECLARRIDEAGKTLTGWS